jgi:NAD+ diphosphatase
MATLPAREVAAGAGALAAPRGLARAGPHAMRGLMPPIPASRPNAYTGNPLDRAGDRRDDDAWIGARLQDPGTRFVPVWRSRSLLRDSAGVLQAVYLPATDAAPALNAGGAWAFLGIQNDRAVFAVDLGAVEDPLPLVPAGAGVFEDLRTVPGGLPPDDAAILAHARGLMHWRGRHGFCGVCGAACLPRSAGNALACTGCGAQHFPRTDPAVIMLVHRGDSVLLGHSARFPKATTYSTLAGFVEPGESLEEAVAREVMEESRIQVGAVHYHSSQPWPFPASIMLGFHAEGLSSEITIDPAELRDARWFTRAELADPAAHNFSLPRRDSIARRLIEDWMAHA